MRSEYIASPFRGPNLHTHPLMQQRFRFIKHMGLEIYYQDLSNTKTVEESIATVQESERRMKALGAAPKSLYMITNIENTAFNMKVFSQVQKTAKVNDVFVKRQCIIGGNSAQRLFNNGLNKLLRRPMYFGKDLNDALHWLVHQHINEKNKLLTSV